MKTCLKRLGCPSTRSLQSEGIGQCKQSSGTLLPFMQNASNFGEVDGLSPQMRRIRRRRTEVFEEEAVARSVVSGRKSPVFEGATEGDHCLPIHGARPFPRGALHNVIHVSVKI